MSTIPTFNDILKASYAGAVARIQATPNFIAMYQQFVTQLTENANKGSLTPFQMQVGYGMLYALVDKLTADGLEVKYWNDTVEARIKFV